MTKRIVIVGGVAGGASAAARLRRLDESAQIIVLERGPYVSFANCGLPYHLGGDIPERDSLLLHTPESLQARFALDVRVNSTVTAVDRTGKTVTVQPREGDTYTLPYDALILAPGASPFRPPVAGLDDARVFTLRNIPDLDRLMAALDGNARHATVVGGGFIGLEVAEALRHRGLDVALVERNPQVMTSLDAEMAAPLADELQAHGVDLHLGEVLEAVEGGERLHLKLQSGASIATDRLILAIGVRPESTLAQAAGLELTPAGAIVVDAQQRTSDPAVFAVGDAVAVRHVVDGRTLMLPLAGPANRQGRIAADVICGREAAYRGSQGTSICKVFDLAAASTGLSAQALASEGIAFAELHLHGNDHAGYYPGAELISLKLLYAPDSGRVLGAQAVGASGVDKRIDVLAMAIQAGMTIDDLAEAELSYAPPFGSAKDLVNLAGMAAQNVRDGLVTLVAAGDVAQRVQHGAQLVDVRETPELEQGLMPGARSLPLSGLRSRSDELDRQHEVIVYCQAGLRGYIAARQLAQQGFQVASVDGGYLTWRAGSRLP
ncbi:FAD-dependent oxidoreductase [Chitinibacteraceae bacterium HSL-7]